jgi:hypothetical protein
MGSHEGYGSTTSASPNDTVDFCIRAEFPHNPFLVKFYRLGKNEELVGALTAFANNNKITVDASENGCRWPVSFSYIIPDSWRSGVYVARLSSNIRFRRIPLGGTTDILFVVRAAEPGAHASILLALTVNTYQAYNEWGGKSLYTYPPSKWVSFDRSGAMTTAWFWKWEYPFVMWPEKNRFDVEYCTSIDLHASRDLLDNYDLLLSVGHDEYWSKEMRDNVEAFSGNGGNLAFFSGDACQWQVRFSDGNRTMICFRNADEDLVANPGLDPRHASAEWSDPSVNRPKNLMTGVHISAQGPWDDEQRMSVDYHVRFENHWVVKGTELHDNDAFGGSDGVVMRSTERSSRSLITCRWQRAKVKHRSTLLSLRRPPYPTGGFYGLNLGQATMGIHRNNGIVFTADMANWSHGVDSNKFVAQITRNVLKRLSCRPYHKIAKTGFEKWGDGLTTPDDWQLEGQGTVHAQEAAAAARSGHYGLIVDATSGETLISQSFDCEGRNYYRVGCWAKADRPGATIRVQSATTWRDFAIARHSGCNGWEYLCALGILNDERSLFSARVKKRVKNPSSQLGNRFVR